MPKLLTTDMIQCSRSMQR